MLSQYIDINEQLAYSNEHDELGELGWIAAAITAVAALVPFLVKALKRDAWSKMDRAEKQQFISDGIIVAKQAVETDQAQSIEQVMQQLVSIVEKNESWSTWKHRNKWAVEMIEDAQLEIETIKNQKAGLFSSKIIGWALLFSALGFAWFKRDWIREKTGIKQIKA
ncbi:MAG: hypothetical protein QM503_06630 [Bacteroidota bacterium]